MARHIVLALVFIVLVGLVSADITLTDAESSPASRGGSEDAAAVDDDAISNTDDDSIGNTDEAAGAPSKSTDGGDAGGAAAIVEGPIGSEEAVKNFAGAAQPTSSSATTLAVSAVAGVAAIAGYFVF